MIVSALIVLGSVYIMNRKHYMIFLGTVAYKGR